MNAMMKLGISLALLTAVIAVGAPSAAADTVTGCPEGTTGASVDGVGGLCCRSFYRVRVCERQEPPIA